jgi:hypothetical protein
MAVKMMMWIKLRDDYNSTGAGWWWGGAFAAR